MLADPDYATVDLAKRVAAEATAVGIPTALIGAMALATHGYVRATDDIDLGACTTFAPALQTLRDRLSNLGLTVTLRAPDDDDPLDGVLVVEERASLVEVVNIGQVRLGRAAIDNAEDLEDGLRCVRVPELVALKLYAGDRRSKTDIHALLDANPGIDLEEITRTCRALGFAKDWAQLLADRS